MTQPIHPQRLTTRLALAALLLLALLAGLRVPLAQAAGITVTTANQGIASGDGCSLREAITNANNDNQSGSTECTAGSGADTITFAGNYTITLASALPPLTNTLTLDGSGRSITVSGNNAVRVFSIQAGAVVTMSQLSIISGTADYGGGISNDGTLTVSHSTFSGNFASRRGGGIYNNDGTLTVSYSTFSGNSIGYVEGNIIHFGSGGGIYNGFGTVTVSHSTFSDNPAPHGAGSGILNFGTVTVSHSTFSGNSAIHGGGIRNFGTLTINHSIFSGNSAEGHGGGILNQEGTLTVSNSTFNDNEAYRGNAGPILWGGGGIANITGTLTVNDSTFNRNSGAEGGGILNRNGTVTVSYNTFGNNSAGHGGGIYNEGGTAAVNYSTFGNNSAGHGGGIHLNSSGTVTVSNSTFSRNSVIYGGGIANTGGTLTMVNSTISGNLANYGSGLYNTLTSTLHLRNSLIANRSSGGDCYNEGTIATNVNNLIEDGRCSDGATGFVSGDPFLNPLGDYGGSTQTFALLPGSPAIDAGDSATCLAAPVNNLDQRGIARTFGASCDIGAFESRGFSLSGLAGTPQSATINTAFTTPLSLTVSSSFGEPVRDGWITFDGGITFPATVSRAGVYFLALSARIDATGRVIQRGLANSIAGSYTITATGRGVGNPAIFNLTNLPFTPTVVVSSSPNPAMFGQSVTFTATVRGNGSPVSGQVGFVIDGGAPISVTLVSGQALLITSTLAAGNHTVTAIYGGDNNHYPNSDVLDGGQTITSANTTTALDSSLNPSLSGQSVTFTATVAAVAPGVDTPTGEVGFVIDGSAPISVTLTGGQASLTISTLTMGNHTITANYGGDNNYNPSSGDLAGGQTVGARLVYLPLISRDFVAAPDLVVESLNATGSQVTVTLRNRGDAPVTDAFWVDVYLNPATAPTGVNQRWQDLGSQGLVWGVQGAALPLDPGESLTLTVGDAYYWPALSSFTAPLPVGSSVYAQVDSVNALTTYGGVLENHEISGGAYNNINGPVSSLAGGGTSSAPGGSAVTAVSSGLPPRE